MLQNPLKFSALPHNGFSPPFALRFETEVLLRAICYRGI